MNDIPAVTERLGTNQELQAVLARAGIFHRVEPDTLASLAKHLQLVEYPGGHTIYVDGDPGERLYIIVSGAVKLCRRFPGGRGLLTIMGPPDMFGALSIFDPGPRIANATAITAVRAVSIDGDALRCGIVGRPKLAEEFLRMMARRVRRSDDDLTDLIFHDGPGRVAKQLLRLAQSFGTHEDGGLRVICDLTQDEMAQLVGSSRETVNKSLSAFARRGWIQVDGKNVLIRDPEGLSRRAR